MHVPRLDSRYPLRADRGGARRRSSRIAASLAAAALVLVTTSASAMSFAGAVRSTSGRPVPGAMVTVADDTRGIAESVYADARGRFEIDTRHVTGAARLRVRAAYFADYSGDVVLEAGTGTRRDITLRPLRRPDEISESLPALYHFGQIAFQPGTPFARDRFQRDCLTCHQVGNQFTRGARGVESWFGTIYRMHQYLGNFDEGLREQRAKLLAAAFDGRPLKVRPRFPVDTTELAAVRVVQYRLDGTLLPHDAEVSPTDGRVYTADQFGDQIVITDLAAGTTVRRPVPQDGVLGGKFARLGAPLPGSGLAALRQGPHSLAIGPDGRWYTTDTIAGQIGVFDPRSDSWLAPIDIPDAQQPSMYPHTIRFDAAGHAWFTIAFSDQVGRLDPATREIKVITLPAAKSLGIAGGSVPYGIDVDPKDGSVWYARLWADRIGRIDPVTLAVEEFDSPVKGPRRLRFDRKGTLWIAGFSEGIVAELEPRSREVKLHPLPEFAPGYRPAAYALAVHPDTQDIWVNETMTDRLYRFIPAQSRWVVYPLPLRGSYTREVSFTKDGAACTSNNPAPAAALEGGVPELICIERKPSTARTAPRLGSAESSLPDASVPSGRLRSKPAA